MSTPSTAGASIDPEVLSQATATSGRGLLVRVLTQPAGALGFAIVCFWVLIALCAPWISPHEPNVQTSGAQLLPFGSRSHLLGTDALGRDILSRVIHGARITVSVGFTAVAIGSLVGSLLGLAAGYFRGLLDTLVMRAADIVLAYPGILLGVVVAAVMGAGTVSVAVAIAIINVPIFARLARSGTLRERDLDYVAACRLEGTSWFRTLIRHIAPNIAGPVLVQASISVGQAILIEAGLSFLGLGVQRPTASWGSMLNESRDYLNDSVVFAVAPGLALASLLLGLTFLADSLRGALDPTSREGR